MSCEVVSMRQMPRIFSEAPALSRVVAVALVALCFLIIALVVRRLRKSEVAVEPRGEDVPFFIPRDTEELGVDFLVLLKNALGGEEEFRKIPVLDSARVESFSIHPSLKSYLKVSPEHMTAQVMKGEDSEGRPFLVYRYCKRDAPLAGKEKAWAGVSPEARVDIFFLRDPEQGRWYLNDEQGNGENNKSSLQFLKKLREGMHPLFQLC